MAVVAAHGEQRDGRPERGHREGRVRQQRGTR
jgi:hypothetical protein